MKKKFLAGLVTGVIWLGISGIAQAISIFVDAAPNKYGSPDYTSWETNTFQSVANGTFVNMTHSINPLNVGTTDFEIEDEVVYSFGDLGKRLTWIYFIENESVASLDAGDRFQISLTNIWDGSSWDFYDYYYGNTWLEPTSWIDYDSDGDGTNDSVIGTAGMAWWGAYQINTQEALDADIQDWGSVDESWIFTARLDNNETSITSNRKAVPEPAAILLFCTGLMGLVRFSGKRTKT